MQHGYRFFMCPVYAVVGCSIDHTIRPIGANYILHGIRIVDVKLFSSKGMYAVIALFAFENQVCSQLTACPENQYLQAAVYQSQRAKEHPPGSSCSPGSLYFQ